MTTREAFADATAGVSGSLVAMLAFYPIDVIKTNLQADKPCGKTITIQNDEYKIECQQHKKRTSIQGLISIIKNLKSFTRGLHYKTAHTVTSSFIYFFLYSWIQSQHRLYHARKHRRRKYLAKGENQRGDFVYQPSTSDRLILSAIAAMMNTVLTLPLDVLAARSQTTIKDDVKTEDSNMSDCEFSSPSHHLPASNGTKKIMDHVWNDTNLGRIEDRYGNTKEGGERLVYSKSYLLERKSTVDEKEMHTGQIGLNNDNECYLKPIENEYKELSPTSNPIFRIDSLSQLWPSSLLPKHQKTLPFNNNLTGLWRGLWPSLLLCSNPSIHFTVFDIVKESVLKCKLGNEGTTLSLGEAFIIGIIAKFAATIVTYPLIRAKVMLMVSEKITKVTLSGGNFREEQNETSMVRLLRNTYTSNGIMGLYKGCQLQLVHTLLKSALLMMVRERISVSSRRLILGKK